MMRIKICCISTVEEAVLAVSAGADAIGLVSEMPSGPGTIDDARIREIATACPPAINRFLLTSRTDAQAIVEQARYCCTDTVQIVDTVDPETHSELRASLPNMKIIQVIHVTDRSVLRQLRIYADLVDAFLLDSGNPNLSVKELGGTGRVHDWTISREIVQQSSRPVFLAGGLTAENVATAIETVRPFGVDVCSGVRSRGELDANKLVRFIKRARLTL